MRQVDSDHIQLIIPAKTDYVGVVRLTVSGLANRLRFSYDDIEDIKIAVTEACTNIVSHAYKGEGMMYLSFYVYDDRIEIVVADRGQGFNLEQVKACLGPINVHKPISQLKEGGLGLFLIDTLMDEVKITEKSGVVLQMTKFLKRDGVEQSVREVSSAQPE